MDLSSRPDQTRKLNKPVSMASSDKEAAEALKEAGESSKKPKDSISPALPKSKEDPLKTSYNTDDSETDEDPSWMFYDTEDSSYCGSLDSKSDDDDELKTKKLKTDGEDSDDDEPKAKKLKTGAEASDDDEPKTKKLKTDGKDSVSSKGKLRS